VGKHASEGLCSYIFFLYCGVDSPSVVFARHFFLPCIVRFFTQVCTEAKNLDASLVELWDQ